MSDAIVRSRRELLGARSEIGGRGRGSADNCCEVIIRLSAAGLVWHLGKARNAVRVGCCAKGKKRKGRLQMMQLLLSAHRNSQWQVDCFKNRRTKKRSEDAR